ncbi:MAG: hypothetical protein Fur0022_16670 [Anaerolineales bacterium]
MSPPHHPPYKPFEQAGYILFLMVVFVLGTGTLLKGWYEVIILQNEGVVTEGVITARSTTIKGDQQITYQFEAPGSNGIVQTYQHSHFITPGIATLPGEPIPIIYLPTRPELSNVVSNRYLILGDRVWATIIIGGIEMFVGVLLGLHLKDWWRTRPSNLPSR